MPRFSANISFLFTELPFQDRFKAASQAGFKGVEFLFPYDLPADDLAGLASDNDLEIVLFNIWPGDWDAGWRGLAGVPGQEAVFAEKVDQALGYAGKLGCKRLHAMAGLVEHGANTETLVSNLKIAADKAGRLGVDILTEPINRKDMPQYLVHTTAQAGQVIAAVGAPNVRLQLDLYHRHVEEGGVAGAIEEFGDLAGHYQIAGPPNRDEPCVGGAGDSSGCDLDYAPLFKQIDASGYQGWIGCEYRPRGDTSAGLSWFRDIIG
jgi:hydroxypyruvate isomerase